MSELLEAALAAFEADRSVIAVRENKIPYRRGWNRYFKERQTEDEVREEFSNGAWGIAKVLYPACADVHLDFDGPHAKEALHNTGVSLPETARQNTVHGWHLIFRASKLLRDLMRVIRKLNGKFVSPYVPAIVKTSVA